MRMFKTLEEQHHNELKNQYRQHQETIFSMQHQIESELLNQQQVLKQKLSVHKEALSNTASPIRSSTERRQNQVESTSRHSPPKSSPRSRQMERLQGSDRQPSPPVLPQIQTNGTPPGVRQATITPMDGHLQRDSWEGNRQ